MEIAFLSPYDPNDVHRWSGTTAHLFACLSSTHHVTWVGKGLLEAARGYHHFVDGTQSFAPELYQKQLGKRLSQQLSQGAFDLIVTTTYYFIPYLRVKAPIVLISDTTFALFKDYAGFSESYSRLALKTERLAFEAVDFIVFASEWARKYAVETCGLPIGKTTVIEFGANLPTPTSNTVKTFEECRLLFVGRDWERKGGNIALNTFQELCRRGLSCQLSIVGCTPPYEIKDERIRIFPYLDKEKNTDQELLQALYAEAHVLIFPTKFDAFGIVICEASAYGVPTIAPNVGGVAQPLSHQKNGILLPVSADVKDYVEVVENLWADKAAYLRLSEICRQEYEDRLNWNVWQQRFDETMEKLIRSQSSCAEPRAWSIPLYAINLLERTERKALLEEQLKDKTEFSVKWVQTHRATNPAKGLWDNMIHAVRDAITHQYDVIILCEDDHIFKTHYSFSFLIDCLKQAEENDIPLLLGGVSHFCAATPVSEHLMAVDWFCGTQFTILFSDIFQEILSYTFQEEDAADNVLSKIISRKAVITPFISQQYDWGYSDIAPTGHYEENFMQRMFKRAEMRMFQERNLHKIFHEVEP